MWGDFAGLADGDADKRLIRSFNDFIGARKE
jgi:hypothetical protein